MLPDVVNSFYDFAKMKIKIKINERHKIRRGQNNYSSWIATSNKLSDDISCIFAVGRPTTAFVIVAYESYKLSYVHKQH